MFAILRGANGRRHEVDFGDDPVTIDVAMSSTTVQVTMAADPGDPAGCRFVTVALPRDALVAAMAAAAARPTTTSEFELRLVGKD
jgi:N-acetylmuramic acid 6-phosphate (MurNAc-6-P) etherase